MSQIIEYRPQVLIQVLYFDLEARINILRFLSIQVGYTIFGQLAIPERLQVIKPPSFISNGRGGRIRTDDHLNPIQVRYQAALHPAWL